MEIWESISMLVEQSKRFARTHLIWALTSSIVRIK